MTYLSGFETSRKPAVTAAAFFLTLVLGSPLSAAELAAFSDDNTRLTTHGQTVGNGYVAPGFVIDGPPVTAPASLPAAKSEPVAKVSAEPAPEAANPARSLEIKKVGSLEAVALPAAPEAPKPVEIASAVSAEKAVEPEAAGPVAVVVAVAELAAADAQVAQAVEPAAGSRAAFQQIAQSSEADANDPLEPINRVMFSINHFLERLILRPVTEMYVLFLPEEARMGVTNFLRNIRSPIVLANDLLQGEGQRAWETMQRFFINSTVGVAGFYDAADKMGIKHHDEDLGQTFAVWGAGEMVYLVLPLFGPSNPRDAVGKFLDRYFDPIWYWEEDHGAGDDVALGRTIAGGIDSYSRVMDEVKKLEETSIDYYAAMRSIYRQKREAEIRNGKAKDVPLPDIRYDFNADVNLN